MANYSSGITLKGNVDSIFTALEIIKGYLSKDQKQENGITYREYYDYIVVTKKKKASNEDYIDLSTASEKIIKNLVESCRGKVKSIYVFANGPYGDYGSISEMHLPFELAELVLDRDFNFSFWCNGDDYGENFYFNVENKSDKLKTLYEITQSDDVVILEEKNTWDIRLKKYVIEGYEDCSTVGSVMEKFKEKRVGFDTRVDVLKRCIGYDNFIRIFNIDKENFSKERYDFLFGMWDITRYDHFIDLCEPCSNMTEDDYNAKVNKLKEINIGKIS